MKWLREHEPKKSRKERLMIAIEHCIEDVKKALSDRVRDKRLEKLLKPYELEMQAHIIAIFEVWEEKIGNLPLEDLELIQLQGMISSIISQSELAVEIKDAMFETFYAGLNINPQTATGFLPATSPFGLADKRALEYFQVFPLIVSERLAKRVELRLRQDISSGVSLGESIPNISRRISELFSDLKGWQAERIARTETRAAFSWGQINAMRGVGAQQWEFYATEDERTCPICAPLHEKRFDIDDLIHLPPKHPNCRCTTLNVIPELDDLEGDVDKYILKWFPSPKMAETEFRTGESIRKILHDMYVVKSMSYRAISKEFDVSHQTAGDWIKKLDILKYNPDQPRVPAGTSAGGQWGGGSGGATGTGQELALIEIARQQDVINRELVSYKDLVAQGHSIEDIIQSSELISQLHPESHIDLIDIAFEKGYYSVPISHTPGGVSEQHMNDYDEYELEQAMPKEYAQTKAAAKETALEDIWQDVFAGDYDKELQKKLLEPDFSGKELAKEHAREDLRETTIRQAIQIAVEIVAKERIDENIDDELRTLWEDHVEVQMEEAYEKSDAAIYNTDINFPEDRDFYAGKRVEYLKNIIIGNEISNTGLFVSDDLDTAKEYGSWQFHIKTKDTEGIIADPDVWHPGGWTNEQNQRQFITGGVDTVKGTVVARAAQLWDATWQGFTLEIGTERFGEVKTRLFNKLQPYLTEYQSPADVRMGRTGGDIYTVDVPTLRKLVMEAMANE